MLNQSEVTLLTRIAREQRIDGKDYDNIYHRVDARNNPKSRIAEIQKVEAELIEKNTGFRVLFVRQIRAQNSDGTPYPYWIDVEKCETVDEARNELKKYCKEYKKTRDVKNNSRIMKITKEVVV